MILDLNKEIKLQVIDEVKEEICKREQIKIDISTVEVHSYIRTTQKINLENKYRIDKRTFTDMYFTYEENEELEMLKKKCVYITDIGVLVYNYSDAEWMVQFYIKDCDKYIGKPLRDYFKAREVEETIINVNKFTTKQTKINIDENCWECGNTLDDNGLCNVCGCSKEINI
ncbi:MAG: hypothetical protein ACRCX8_07230 [Sarcina sp.]